MIGDALLILHDCLHTWFGCPLRRSDLGSAARAFHAAPRALQVTLAQAHLWRATLAIRLVCEDVPRPCEVSSVLVHRLGLLAATSLQSAFLLTHARCVSDVGNVPFQIPNAAICCHSPADRGSALRRAVLKTTAQGLVPNWDHGWWRSVNTIRYATDEDARLPMVGAGARLVAIVVLSACTSSTAMPVDLGQAQTS